MKFKFYLENNESYFVTSKQENIDDAYIDFNFLRRFIKTDCNRLININHVTLIVPESTEVIEI